MEIVEEPPKKKERKTSKSYKKKQEEEISEEYKIDETQESKKRGKKGTILEEEDTIQKIKEKALEEMIENERNRSYSTKNYEQNPEDYNEREYYIYKNKEINENENETSEIKKEVKELKSIVETLVKTIHEKEKIQPKIIINEEEREKTYKEQYKELKERKKEIHATVKANRMEQWGGAYTEKLATAFLEEFDGVAKLDNITGEDKNNLLQYYLKNSAAKFVRKITEKEPNIKYEEIKAKIKARYEPDEPKVHAKLRFDNATREKEESYPAYLERLEELADMAFEGEPEKIWETMMKNKCIKDSVNFAMQCNLKVAGNSMDWSKFHHQAIQLAEMHDKQYEKRKEFQKNKEKWQNKGEKSKAKFNGNCNNCGKYGHKEADCFSKKRGKTIIKLKIKKGMNHK